MKMAYLIKMWKRNLEVRLPKQKKGNENIVTILWVTILQSDNNLVSYSPEIDIGQNLR